MNIDQSQLGSRFEKPSRVEGESSPFSSKTEEYFVRIEEGKETIEKILEGVNPHGAIYNALKEKMYNTVPSDCRDNKNKPFPYPVLEDFLKHQTLTVNKEENLRNQRLRDAILYFSKVEWNKEEGLHQNKVGEQQKLAETKKDLGIEEVIETPSVAGQNDIQPETISPEKERIQLEKEIQLPETQRFHDQEIIGDLNGSYESFVEHLLNRDLISIDNDELVWKGQDKEVVFIGDILGDRKPEGLKIYDALLKLKQQAEKEEGDVVWLSGNHENMFNAVLTGFTTEFGKGVEEDMGDRLYEYPGNLELVEFLPDEIKQNIITTFLQRKDSILHDVEALINKKEKSLQNIQANSQLYEPSIIKHYTKGLADLKEKYTFIQNTNESVRINEFLSMGDLLPLDFQKFIGRTILENRDSIRGSMRSEYPHILESIKEQNLIHMKDGVLYVHTNLTNEMIEMIFGNMSDGSTITDAIGKINIFYKSCLSAYIDGKGGALTPPQVKYFNTMRDVFISTSRQSRVNFSEDPQLTDGEKEQMRTKLKSLGVDAIIHGHNDEGGEVKGFSDLPILSIDRSMWKDNNLKNQSPKSAASISKSGILSYF